MSPEVPAQREASPIRLDNPPFSRSAVAAFVRSRDRRPTAERVEQVNSVETAFATGALLLENLDLTTELL